MKPQSAQNAPASGGETTHLFGWAWATCRFDRLHVPALGGQPYPFKKLSSKSDVWDPNGRFPPANPSEKVGERSCRSEEAVCTPHIGCSRKPLKELGLPPRALLRALTANHQVCGWRSQAIPTSISHEGSLHRQALTENTRNHTVNKLKLSNTATEANFGRNRNDTGMTPGWSPPAGVGV